MLIALGILAALILLLLVIKQVKNFSTGAFAVALALIALGTTITLCCIAPKMHKQFSVSVIEYLIKINDDGSMSTTKKTTQTILQKQQTGENQQ